MIVSSIRSVVRGWSPFWFGAMDPRPLALFRILAGLLCCCMFAASLPNWNRFYAADGIISLSSTDFPNSRVNSPLGLYYWTEGLLPIEAHWVFGMAVSVMFLVGWKTRWATAGLLISIDAMLWRNPYLANGEELVLRMCLLYCLFINTSAVWSLDARRKQSLGLAPQTWLRAWPVRMMQINVALIYAISLPYKLAQDPGWVTGDAMHWTIASDMWGPYQHPWLTLAFGGVLRKVMSFGTVFVEGFFPLAVWFPVTRRPALLLITALHLGISVMIPNVTFFTLAMVCAFAAFTTGEDWAGLSGLGRRWLRTRATIAQ